MAWFPTAEQLAVAWVKTVPEVDPSKVATTLPADAAGWAASGFVQVGIVGGSPSVHTPLLSTVVSVHCWAANLNSNRPPWGRAGSLAAAIVWATYGHPAAVVDLGVEFHRARLLSVYPLSSPRRIPGDEAGFAHVEFDAAMAWTVTA